MNSGKSLILAALCLTAAAVWAHGEARVDVIGNVNIKDFASEKMKASRFEYKKGKPQYEQSALFISSPLTSEWQELEFSFVPEEDGRVTIFFHVPGSRNPEKIKPILIDDVKSNGEEVKNGGFELLSGKKAQRWKFHGIAELVTGESAAEGKNCVKVLNNGSASQIINVKGGEKVTVKFKAKLAAPAK